MLSQPITFITSHAKKAEQLSWHLKHPIAHQKLDLPEIQSLDPHEVVTHKAQEAYKSVRKPVLVEDISIRFEALGKLPGPLIKWFLEELKPEGICRLLDGYSTRTAFVEPYFALTTDGADVHIFSTSMEGTIAPVPRGENGFGLDSVFVPKGYTKTWGEMNEQEQIKTSVRKLALAKLQDFLTTEKSQ